jgi:lipopolysaccharide export LptBFGC system permease protein LptF
MVDKEELTVVREKGQEELKLQIKQLENINQKILSQLDNLEKEIKKQVETHVKQTKQTKHRFNAQFSLSIMLALFAIIRAYMVSITVKSEHELVHVLIIAVLVLSFLTMIYFCKKVWYNVKHGERLDKSG